MTARRIRSKAPLRISFCGGGTDVEPYASEHGGVVLNATIDRYAYATIIDSGQSDIVVKSLDYNLIAQFDLEQSPVYNGQLDLAKAVLKWLNRQDGANSLGYELYLHTDAPPGSGLGSSSALVVAMLTAFAAWRRAPLTNYELAHLAYRLERADLGIKGGMQDQYAATFGGFNLIEFGTSGVVVNPLRIPSDTINELQYCLVLCYTGGTRQSAQIIDNQVSNYRTGQPEVVAAMQELKDLTIQMKNALVLSRLSDFGHLMHEAWLNKKKLSNKISTPRIDEIYDETRRAGALGGKMSGAGGGGYMYFFCPGETRHQVGARLEAMGLQLTRFAFEPMGVVAWETG